MRSDRLTEVETKLAFQEDTIQALNEVVCRQQKQIEQLEAGLKILAGRFRQLSEDRQAGGPSAHEKPPHY